MTSHRADAPVRTDPDQPIPDHMRHLTQSERAERAAFFDSWLDWCRMEGVAPIAANAQRYVNLPHVTAPVCG